MTTNNRQHIFYPNVQKSISKLKIYKLLKVGCDELIDDEHCHNHHQGHNRQWHIGEPQAISAFEIRWQPMYNHS